MNNFDANTLFDGDIPHENEGYVKDKSGWDALFLNAPDGKSYIIGEDFEGDRTIYNFNTEEEAKKEWEYTKKAYAKHLH